MQHITDLGEGELMVTALIYEGESLVIPITNKIKMPSCIFKETPQQNRPYLLQMNLISDGTYNLFDLYGKLTVGAKVTAEIITNKYSKTINGLLVYCCYHARGIDLNLSIDQSLSLKDWEEK